jgi:hypothetical protein
MALVDSVLNIFNKTPKDPNAPKPAPGSRSEREAKIKDKVTSREINSARHGTDRWFRFVGIPFQPYDLRHGWAIRAHILGVPIKAAADNLGHSVQIHTKTYQRWFSLDMRKLAINQALSKRNEVELIKDENTGLKLENERLKIEMEKLRMEMVYKRS